MVTADLMRKLSKYAVDGGHGTTIRLQKHLDKLKAASNQPQNATELLDLLRHLAFSGTAGSTSATGAAGASSAAVPARLTRAEADANSRGTSRTSSRETEAPAAAAPERRPAARTADARRDEAAAAATPPARAPVKEARPKALGAVEGDGGPPLPKAEMLRLWRQRMGE